MQLRASAMTHRGQVRATNEDAFASRPELGLFVVCDGMGGAAAGEVASQLAVQTIVDEVQRPPGTDPAASAGAPYRERTTRLANAIHLANATVFDRAQTEVRYGGMGTTVVALWAAEHVASIVHVGDSRAYLWHDGHLAALTRDHSLAEAEVRAGILDRDSSMQSQHQNVLLRALGPEMELEPEVTEVPVAAGDYLLLCSDGLTRTVNDRELESTIDRLKDPQQICNELIDAANRNGAPDNVTAVVVEVG